MSAPWAITFFVVTLMFLILIHELGHFVTAKRSGIKVLEFGIGFPPRIWGKQHGETLYSINWIPLGGFCKMLGEDDPSEPRSLASQSAGTRLLVLSAGSLVMLIFPIILFTIVYMVPHDIVIGGEGIEVQHVVEDAPAYEAGILKDDEIIAINGSPVITSGDLKALTDENLGKETTVTVDRDGEQLDFSLVPRTEYPANQGPMGIGIVYARSITETESDPPWTALRKGLDMNKEMYLALRDSLDGLSFEDMGGVVAAGDVTVEIAKEATWEDMALWAGLLSANLGIINLLPIPALDGGRIVFVLLEIGRRGRRISPEKEGLVHAIGFMMLIAFMVLIMYRDIDRIISGESLLP